MVWLSSISLYVFVSAVIGMAKSVFVMPMGKVPSSRRNLSSLFVRNISPEEEKVEESQEEAEYPKETLDALRRRLAIGHQVNHFMTDTSDASPRPLMTVQDRQHRLVEIQLLQQLRDLEASSSSVAPQDQLDLEEKLVSHWRHERGDQAHFSLKEAQQMAVNQAHGHGKSNNKNDLQEAETRFWSLARQFPTTWAEPYHGLAHLSLVQGRLDEAKRFCEVALSLKPWHFQAQTTMSSICAFQKDVPGILHWSSQMLPTVRIGNNNNNKGTNNQMNQNKIVFPTSNGNKESISRAQQKRLTWFDNAIEEAQKALQDEEDRLARKTRRNA